MLNYKAPYFGCQVAKYIIKGLKNETLVFCAFKGVKNCTLKILYFRGEKVRSLIFRQDTNFQTMTFFIRPQPISLPTSTDLKPSRATIPFFSKLFKEGD
jgi:hypothetical protein